MNGDGYADIAVSVVDLLTVNIYLGGPNGISTTPAAQLVGPQTNANYAQMLAGVGDVDGDGYADLVVNAPQFGGGAYLYRGSAQGISDTLFVKIPAPDDTGGFGYAVAGAGDVNGDGLADVIISAINSFQDTGELFVLLGSQAGLVLTPATTLPQPPPSEGFYFGWSVASAGDVDGDGYSDVVGTNLFAMGTDSSYIPARAVVYRGSASGIISTPSNLLLDQGFEDQYGVCVAGVGDVDGDGFADLVVGAPGVKMGSGEALFYRGSPTGPAVTPDLTFTAPGAAYELGSVVVGATD